MFEFAEDDKIFVPPSHTAIGKRGEDIVAKDLTKRGFYIYVSISHISPCDLIAQKGNELFRVAVKTRTNGNMKTYDHNVHDLLARVNLDTETIGYAWKHEALGRLLAAKEA